MMQLKVVPLIKVQTYFFEMIVNVGFAKDGIRLSLVGIQQRALTVRHWKRG